MDTSSTPTSKRWQMCFHRHKGVEGVALINESHKFYEIAKFYAAEGG